MDEKLKKIEKILLEENSIDLGKQCKGEYIIYNFYNVVTKNNLPIVKRMCKEHYKDKSLNELKKISKKTLFDRTLKITVYVYIRNLLERGYDIINIGDEII